MNQWQIWTVVKPTVGLPLLLGGVAVTSLAVHYSILSHTTWMAGYWEGAHKKVAEATVSPTALTAGQAAYTVSVAPAAPGANGAAAFTVTVTPNVTVGDAGSPPAN